MLEINRFAISMTESGDPRENPIAERVNGILKDEFNLDANFDNFKEAELCVNKSIETYNSLRPHLSLDYQTPNQVHNNKRGEIEKRWKNYKFYAKKTKTDF
jgi:transposase InsO family protein